MVKSGSGIDALAKQTLRGTNPNTGGSSRSPRVTYDLFIISAACVGPHPTGANYFTVELTVLQEMSQALADLFGLKLPVSGKKQAHRTPRYQGT